MMPHIINIILSQPESEASMANVPTENTIWTTMQYYDGEFTLSENSLYFHRASGGIDNAFLANWALIMFDWGRNYIMPLLSYQQHLFVTSAFDLSSIPYNLEFHVEFPGVAGSKDKELPLNCGFRLEFETGVEGRSFQGHNTVCGLAREDVEMARVSETFALNLLNAYYRLFEMAAAAGMEWVVVSRRTGGADRPAGVVTPITLARYEDLVIDSWRQRLPTRHS